jgi:hypothetical protein
MFSIGLLQNIFIFFHYCACRNVVALAGLHMYRETYRLHAPFISVFQEHPAVASAIIIRDTEIL